MIMPTPPEEVVGALVERIDPTLRNVLQEAVKLKFPIEDRASLIKQVEKIKKDPQDNSLDIIWFVLNKLHLSDFACLSASFDGPSPQGFVGFRL
jgi:hypothetical protein